MARTPRRSRTADDDETLVIDPLESATLGDQIETAGELSGMFDALRAYDQNTIKGVLFRKPPNGLGKFEWIEDLGWPFDMSAIMASLKANWGGGAYRLQILAGHPQKTRKVVEFNIADDGKSKLPVGNTDSLTMFQMMMQMQMEAGRESRAASDRMMQMMMQNSQQMTSVLVAAMGNRESAKDLIPLVAAMRGEEPKGGNLKETVETIAAIKGLFPNGDASGLGSLDADGLIDGALKLAGPVAGAIGRAMEARRERLDGSPHVGDAAPGASTGLEPAARPLMLARPAPAPEPRLVAEGSGRFPILDGIRADILYFFSRRHDPELAAEAIVGILEPIDAVAEQGINDLVGAFAISPDWKADLAAEGIDLRADPEWAEQFLAALIAEWTDPDRGDDDTERGAGDLGDASRDGEARTDGLNGHGGAEPRG